MKPTHKEVRWMIPRDTLTKLERQARKLGISSVELARRALACAGEGGLDVFEASTSHSRADIGTRLLELIEARIFGPQAESMSAAALNKATDNFFKLKEAVVEKPDGDITRMADVIRGNYGKPDVPGAVRLRALEEAARWEQTRIDEFEVERNKLDELRTEWLGPVLHELRELGSSNGTLHVE